MSFVRKHWNGGYVLNIAFWLNFVLLGSSYHFLEPYLLRPFAGNPSIFVALSIAYLVVTRLIVFPWQIVGVLRSADRHFATYDRTIVLYTVQAMVLVALVGTISHIIGSAQKLVVYRENNEYKATLEPPNYTVTLINHEGLIRLSGTLDFGVTEAVAIMLREHPSVTGIVLESDGGQTFEGRGLALLFEKHNLDTYTFSTCTSSCTTAFIGGKSRYLGTKAKLGFHQYAFDADRIRQFSPFYDVEKEQQKDLDLYRSKNVDAAFLQRMFATPNNSMWYPTMDSLIDAGVVTRVVKESDTVDVRQVK